MMRSLTPVSALKNFWDQNYEMAEHLSDLPFSESPLLVFQSMIRLKYGETPEQTLRND